MSGNVSNSVELFVADRLLRFLQIIREMLVLYKLYVYVYLLIYLCFNLIYLLILSHVGKKIFLMLVTHFSEIFCYEHFLKLL